MIISSEILPFTLPPHLSCPPPTEERGVDRDAVRLMVSSDSEPIQHTTFAKFADFLDPGDVLVVNTSATLPAAFRINLPNGNEGVVHFSTQIEGAEWLVEVREIQGTRTVRWHGGSPRMQFNLPGDAMLELRSNFYDDRNLLNLWVAKLASKWPFREYAHQFGSPIQYQNLDRQYPLAYYQTIFAKHPGSAEMPSAGRGFTQSLLNRLQRKGVAMAPIVLHTGVSSLEENEAPYAEYYRIDPVSAAMINRAKQQHKRIVAVGTTAVRATESATDDDGTVVASEGKTDLYIRANHPLKTVTALLTGFHEPKASHLQMLHALAGHDHLEHAYHEAIEQNYFWHQFGDLHLILSGPVP